MAMEQQIEDLQARMAFLEDSIDHLTRTQLDIQNAISEMRHMLQHLQQQLQQLTPSQIDASVHQKPPHY